MKAIGKAYITKRECSVQEAVYLIIPELWLRKIFPRAIFLSSNLPEKRFRIFKKKAQIDAIPSDNTDIFKRYMLDRYFDRPNEIFKSGEYIITDQLCFPDFLSLYYIDAKQIKISENNSQPVVLNNELIDSSHEANLECQKVKAVSRYHQHSPNKNVEQYPHHLLFVFYTFFHEEELKYTAQGLILLNFRSLPY